MKRFLIIAFLGLSTLSFGQLNFGVELGGSNFVGTSFHVEPVLRLSDNSDFRFKLGFGSTLIPLDDAPLALFQFGLSYHYQNWSIGTDASTFTDMPLIETRGSGWVDLLIYPHVGYTWNFTGNYYLEVTAGAYLAFSEYPDWSTGANTLQFEGDVIPGVGITFGGIFSR